MKKKIVMIIVAAVLLVGIVFGSVVYRIMQEKTPIAKEVPFLPSELPVAVKVAYFDEQLTWYAVDVSESDLSTAISHYQALEQKPRYHSDTTVELNGSWRLFLYNKYIENNGGALQFYFAQPLQYNHGDICACKSYHYAEATYDHIDLIYNEDVLLVNFISGDKIIATYNMQGSYLPSFREIISAYNPAAFVE